MDAIESLHIIEVAGGDSAFARLLRIDGQPGHQQRVNNWKRRGIPASVVLEHLEIIQKLRAQASPDNTSTSHEFHE